MKEGEERRRFVRVVLEREVVMVSRSGLGRLVDLSEGGFCAKFLSGGFRPQAETRTNIFSKGDIGCCILDIPYQVVWERDDRGTVASVEPYSLFIGVQFHSLNPQQHEAIKNVVQREETFRLGKRGAASD